MSFQILIDYNTYYNYNYFDRLLIYIFLILILTTVTNTVVLPKQLIV